MYLKLFGVLQKKRKQKNTYRALCVKKPQRLQKAKVNKLFF